nr:hypothetical protein [Tanacetum cinerariifolium]
GLYMPRIERGILSMKGGEGGRGVKKNQNGLGNVIVKDDVDGVSSVAKNSGSNDVTTPTLIMEKTIGAEHWSSYKRYYKCGSFGHI